MPDIDRTAVRKKVVDAIQDLGDLCKKNDITMVCVYMDQIRDYRDEEGISIQVAASERDEVTVGSLLNHGLLAIMHQIGKTWSKNVKPDDQGVKLNKLIM